MTAKIVSVANMKGGVGKTTITVALAQQFASGVVQGAQGKVLVVDLDAQANASFWLCGDGSLTTLIEAGKTIEAFLEDAIVFNKSVKLGDYVFAPKITGLSDGKISVIPSSPELRMIEREITVFLARRKRSLLEVEKVVSELFESNLRELAERFDVIVFDSAPGISALTEAALRASDVIIVPTVPDFISNLGLEAFCRTVSWSAPEAGVRKKPWVVANLVKGVPAHQAMLAEMRAEASEAGGDFNMFTVEIPDFPWREPAGGGADSSGERFTSDERDLFRKLAMEVASAWGES